MLEQEEMAGSSLIELAKNLADVLKFEFHYETRKKWEFPNILYDAPPPRDDPIFQRKRDAIKGKLSKPLENQKLENKCRRLFCFAHGEFVLPSNADIEHSYPYAKVRYNQKRLLDYLNDKKNEDFKKAFLAQEGIRLYFREDHDGIVKGSSFFYYLCYSEMDNLFLLCHSCNLHKSKTEPELWFKRSESFFGDPFIDEMALHGGLHEGILFDRVHRVKQSFPCLKFSDGTSVALPVEGSLGLGKFISHWFSQRFKPVFEENKEFYNAHYLEIKEHIETIRDFIQSDQKIKASKAHLRFMGQMKMLSILQRELVGFKLKQTSSGSETGSDDAEGRENDIKRFEKNIAIFKEDTYAILKIRNCILDWYNDKQFAKKIRYYCQDLIDEDISLMTHFETIFCQLQLFLEEYSEENGDAPSQDELKQKIKELCLVHSPEEAKKRAEEKAQKEEAARIAAQEEILQLKLQLQQLKIQQSSQSSEQSMAESTFFKPVSSGSDVTMEDVSQHKEKSSEQMDIENIDEQAQKKFD